MNVITFAYDPVLRNFADQVYDKLSTKLDTTSISVILEFLQIRNIDVVQKKLQEKTNVSKKRKRI